MVPTGWNTDGAIGRTAGRVDGRIVLIVGNDATANASTLDDGTDDARNGTTLWRSTGTKHSNNSLTGPTTTGPTDRNK